MALGVEHFDDVMFVKLTKLYFSEKKLSPNLDMCVWVQHALALARGCYVILCSRARGKLELSTLFSFLPSDTRFTTYQRKKIVSFCLLFVMRLWLTYFMDQIFSQKV